MIAHNLASVNTASSSHDLLSAQMLRGLVRVVRFVLFISFFLPVLCGFDVGVMGGGAYMRRF